MEKIRRNPQEHWIAGNSQAGAVSSKHEVVIAIQSVWIVQPLASDAVQLQEDKNATAAKMWKQLYVIV